MKHSLCHPDFEASTRSKHDAFTFFLTTLASDTHALSIESSSQPMPTESSGEPQITESNVNAESATQTNNTESIFHVNDGITPGSKVLVKVENEHYNNREAVAIKSFGEGVRIQYFINTESLIC